MQIVATIRPGYTIKTEVGNYLVCASQKFRTGYKYICKDATGRKVSIDREDVLQGQREGVVSVVLY